MKIGDSKWTELLIEGITAFNLEISQQQVQQIILHASELSEWNKKINLTAITDPFEICVKHMIDSLALLKFIKKNQQLLDMGSGGGFPGIPLKIMAPAIPMILIDASRKKVGFLKHVIRTLDLKNIHALHCRAESFPRHKSTGLSQKNMPLAPKEQKIIENRENGFGVVVSRAFSSLDKIIQLSLPLIENRARILALKGRINKEEIGKARQVLENTWGDGIKHSTGYSMRIERYRLPHMGADRSIVQIDIKGQG